MNILDKHNKELHLLLNTELVLGPMTAGLYHQLDIEIEMNSISELGTQIEIKI